MVFFVQRKPEGQDARRPATPEGHDGPRRQSGHAGPPPPVLGPSSPDVFGTALSAVELEVTLLRPPTVEAPEPAWWDIVVFWRNKLVLARVLKQCGGRGLAHGEGSPPYTASASASVYTSSECLPVSCTTTY